jgi:hypothetical protein
MQTVLQRFYICVGSCDEYAALRFKRCELGRLRQRRLGKIPKYSNI